MYKTGFTFQKILLMKGYKFFLLSNFILISTFVAGQNFEVPANYQFNTKEDYSRHEKDIIEATKWLQSTPLNEQKEKREQVSAFVIKWVNGSPTVNVELNSNILGFDEKNPGMLALYMAGSAKYVLENNYSKDMRQSIKQP